MKNIQKFILVVFFLLLYTNSQSQEKKAHLLFPVKKDVAIITLPDILVKRDTIIVTNDNKGSLKSTGSKIPATYFKDLKEYSFFFETFFDKDFSEEETIGRMTLSFVIEKDGYVTNIKITNPLTTDAGFEVLRVIKKMKKWQPAMKRKKKPIRTEGYLTIYFDIEEMPKEKPLKNSIQIIRHSCN